MHEVSLVSALIEQIEETAVSEKFSKVVELRLSIGQLSGVDADCLNFCFPEVTKASLLEGAKLILETEGAEIICQVCNKASTPSDPYLLRCQFCQASNVKVSKGREFKILDLEVI